jgi:hypothetical protein
MPAHDIIDNRNEKLVDHIRRILDSSDMARFAVGYFFLSGFGQTRKRKPLRGLPETEWTEWSIAKLQRGF